MGVLSLVVDIVSVVCLLAAHWDNSWLPVGDVARCLDIIPFLLIANLSMGFLTTLGDVNFQSEACQLDTRINRDSPDAYQMSGDFFRVGVPVGLLLSAPFLDRLVFPWMARRTGRRVQPYTKILTGICFAVCGSLAGAAIEYARRHAGSTGIPSKCAPLMPDGSHVLASHLSAWVMFVPYLLTGIGEAFWAPTMYQLAYEGSPAGMKPLMQAFNLFTMGAMPNAIAASISRAVAPLTPNSLDDGNITAVFFIIASLGLLGIALLVVAYQCATEEVRNIGQEALPELADRKSACKETGASASNPVAGAVGEA